MYPTWDFASTCKKKKIIALYCIIIYKCKYRRREFSLLLLSFAVCQRPGRSGSPHRPSPMSHQRPGLSARGGSRLGMHTKARMLRMSQASARHWLHSLQPCLSSKSSFWMPSLGSCNQGAWSNHLPAALPPTLMYRASAWRPQGPRHLPTLRQLLPTKYQVQVQVMSCTMHKCNHLVCQSGSCFR